jgi:phosphatidylglycerophosphate synthase
MEDQKRHCWFIWNLANFISSLRFLAPIILFATSWNIETKMITYLVLAFTDYLDGKVAKWVGNTGGIGGFIEKTADKVMQGAGLIFLLFEELLEDWLAIPIMSGELFVVLLVLYGIYLVIKYEVREKRSKSLKKIYRDVKSEIIRSLIASEFGRTKMFVYGIGAGFIFLNIIWPNKFFRYCYILIFCTGIIFCVGVIIEYYKNFIIWRSEFFKN